jgi:hypothetical protein
MNLKPATTVHRANRERPDARQFLRSLLPRWNLRNLFVLSGLLLLLFAVERVGRRADFTTYRHGWPFTYFVRDYRKSAAFQTTARYAPSGSWWGYDWNKLELLWKRDGLSIECERLMNPWASDNIETANLWLALPDALVGLLIAMIVTKLFDRRSGGKPLFRFRLRTAIGILTLAGLLCAIITNWRSGHEQDLQILTDNTAGERAPYVTDHPPTNNLWGWHPPVWLPEGIAKIPIFAPWFERLDTVELYTPELDAIDRLSRLPYLKSLTWDHNGEDGAALERVADLSSLDRLNLHLDRCASDGLLPLARISKLKRLTIDGFAVTDAVVDQLNSLPSLEEIEIGQAQCSRINVHGLKKLRCLQVFAVGRPIELPSPFQEVSEMPNAKRPADGFFHPVVRLSDLPSLDTVSLEAISLDETCISNLSELHTMKYLWIDSAWANARASATVDLCGSESLERLDLYRIDGAKKITVRDMPRLKSVVYCGPDAESVLLERLPSLESIDLGQNEKLSIIDIRSAPNVRELVAGPGAQSFGGLFSYVISAATKMEVRGLSDLSKLERLNLASCAMNSEIIADISGLTELVSLNLSGTDLTDAQLAELDRLKKLRELGLVDTDVSLAGWKVLDQMPNLNQVLLPGPFLKGAAQILAVLRASHPGIAIDSREQTPRGFGTGSGGRSGSGGFGSSNRPIPAAEAMKNELAAATKFRHRLADCGS